MLKPKIIKKINHDYYTEEFTKPTILYKNMKESTSRMSLSLLEKTVKEGTANKAYLEELNIGGKTGTAEIWNMDNHRYSTKDFFSSFASIFPIDDPKYVMVISIEAPTGPLIKFTASINVFPLTCSLFIFTM